MTCDDGAVLAVNLRSRNQRVEMQILVLSAAAVPPSGYLDVLLDNQATSAFVNGFGSVPGSFVNGESITNLGSVVPVGPLTLEFSAIVHDGGVVTGPALETCTATIVTSAK